MNKAAVYARYSCENQRETSIDDQIRRCRELAQRQQLSIADSLIFTDAALSGTDKHRDRRDGYKAMLEAWDAGQFDFILADDFNRLTRDGVEQAYLVRRLERNLRVKLLTTNGIDTRIQNWQLQVGMLGVVGQQAIRDTQGLVVRGMLGQLERGFMVAAPAFGYVLDREFDSQGGRIGTHWKVDDAAAKIVREVFHKRGHGQSMHQIARWLNELGVPLQRVSKRADGGYWRAARVSNILRNPIYRGEFLWNASATIRARAKKSGRELKVESFARPQLRLVSDELWYRCNDNIISRSGYGGGKHALAGLVTCGDCGSVLVLSSQSRCRSLYCASCTTAKAMGVQPRRQTSTVATAGVEKLLRTALHAFLTPVFINTFRAKLQKKLSGNPGDDIQKQERELARHKSAQDRFSRMLGATEQDDPVLMARYEESREKVRSIGVRLQALSSVRAEVNQDVINAQMQVDPGVLLDSVFESAIAPERLRALLARLFPEIVFEGKPDGRYTSTFRIRFAVGQALALASETDCLLSDTSQVRYQLSYHPIRKGQHEPGWSVQELPDEQEHLDDSAPVDEHLQILSAHTGQFVPAQLA